MIKEITEDEFKNNDNPILFENKLTDRLYGIISLGNYSFKLAWQSTVSKPKIHEINLKIYAIGIDQNFAIIDFNSGEIILETILDYFYYDVKIYEKYVYVITELEIIKIDKDNFEIIEKYELPDFYEDMEFEGNNIKIKCSGGIRINL